MRGWTTAESVQRVDRQCTLSLDISGGSTYQRWTEEGTAWEDAGCPDEIGGGTEDSWNPDPRLRDGHPRPNPEGGSRVTQRRDTRGHNRRLGLQVEEVRL
jgi:hypothetical protein